MDLRRAYEINLRRAVHLVAQWQVRTAQAQ